MADPARSDLPAKLAVSVRLDGRSPYAMFELVELTAAVARLRGPLMLELGEEVALRFTRAGRTVDTEGRVAAIARDDAHGDPVTTVDLADGAALAPILP